MCRCDIRDFQAPVPAHQAFSFSGHCVYHPIDTSANPHFNTRGQIGSSELPVLFLLYRRSWSRDDVIE